MVRILYDFDISKINNCRYFNQASDISMLTSNYTSKLLRESDLIYDYQLLGGGYDSVCFIENKNQTFYIIEPANGLIVSYEMIVGLIKYELEKNRRIVEDFTFGVTMSDTVFRPHRNDDEIMVIGSIRNYSNEENSEVCLEYPGSTYTWECNYLDFVPELVRFGERMMHLYDQLLPDFREYALYPELKAMLLDDNILRQKYGHLMEFDNLGKSFMDYIERDLW